ncbi:DUF2537 domain-containing protein [Segniliparus rugosus]|nr:DUF2537 domain-containing protein [Segniliparus rugosus]
MVEEQELQEQEPQAQEEFEDEPIAPDMIRVGFALALYSAAVTAVVVLAVTRGLLDLQVMFPLGIVLALVVNVGVVAGVMPAMQVWRRTPVLRWLVWGSWAGAFVGWTLVIVLEILDSF